MTSDGYEQRFAALLKPIRDLQKNWEIDIAYYLEPYLEELQLIRVTFDGGQTTLNFAEAAMVIQGSASIYSKKVDYLYNLVKELLELLNSRKKDKKGSNRDEGGEDVEQHRTDELLDLEKFNLVDDDAQELPPVKLRTRAPVDLIPLDSDERGNANFYDVKGDLIGSKGDFKLNAWHVTADGICVYSLPFYHAYAMVLPDELPTGNQTENACVDRDNSDDDYDFENGPEPMSVGGGDNFNSHVEDAFKTGNKSLGKSAPNSPDPAKPDKQATDEKRIRAVWKPICAFDINPAKVPPMRKGRTLKSGRKEVMPTKASSVRNAVVPKFAQFSDSVLFSHASKFPKEEFSKPSVDAFGNLFYKEFKERKSMEKSEKPVSSEEVAEDEPKVCNEMVDDNINHSDDDDVGAGDLEDMERPQNESFGEIGDAVSLGISVTLSETHLNETYEEMIKRHTDDYLVKARDEVKLSVMEKKVLEWSNSLSGVLTDEEKRENFDIRCYCTRVLDKFVSKPSPKGPKNTITFADVVETEQPYNVARLFLSTLQLANNYNVEIRTEEQQGAKIAKPDQLQLTLLSKRQHYEEFDEFHT